MIKIIITTFIATALVFVSSLVATNAKQKQISGAPPYGLSAKEVPGTKPLSAVGWERPEGPAKVALQVGHWKNDEVPEELKNLRNNTGARGGGKWEWEVNYKIAQLMAEYLSEEGVLTEILPTTVPPAYWADVFLAIHADGSTDRSKSGYKFAGPWRDFTGKSGKLVAVLEKHYEEATGLTKDENITRNMRGYYAFAWWRYEHAVHPMTTAVIAETGFLTNQSDQKLLIGSPEISAKAMSRAIVEYLEGEGLLGD